MCELEYIGAVQDVTDRQLSEEALGKARSELAHVAASMSLGALTRQSRTKLTNHVWNHHQRPTPVCGC